MSETRRVAILRRFPVLMLLLKVLSGMKDNLNLNFVDQSSSLGLGKVIFYAE